MTDEKLRRILEESRRIAVVGLSDDPFRPSYGVAHYMQRQGYAIVPVNPRLPSALGVPAVPNLHSIEGAVDIVDIFRRSEFVGATVDDAIAIGAKAIWMQLGVMDRTAAQRAQQAGLFVIMNSCIKIEHARLLGSR
ncbi:MAG: CoA-binding protein [Herpetosiphon sp.]